MLSRVILLSLVSCLAWAQCPNKALIAPCVCRGGYEVEMVCENLKNHNQLSDIMHHVSGIKITRLSLTDSTFDYLPSGVFSGFTLERLTFERTKLKKVAVDEFKISPFAGVKNTLRRIDFYGFGPDNNLDYESFQVLRRLDHIDIAESDVETLSENFSKMPPSLTKLEVYISRLYRIKPGALADLENLESISIRVSELTAARRDMFPTNAENLETIDLSMNHLTYLDSNLFRGMPSLREIRLSKNCLTYFHESTFKPVWRQLESFVFYDNPLVCSDEVAWLKRPNNLRELGTAKCKYPPSLAGKELHEVNLEYVAPVYAELC